MVSCDVITSGKHTPLISAYIPIYTLEHLLDLEEALTRFQNQNPIVPGGLNDNIGQSQNPQSHQVADLLIDFGLVDLLLHFRKLWRFRHLKT